MHKYEVMVVSGACLASNVVCSSSNRSSITKICDVRHTQLASVAIIVAHGLELIFTRNSGRNVEISDRRLAQLFEMHGECPQLIAMRHHKHMSAIL